MTRDVITKPSIDAAIDGGNFLSNGAPRGERIYIIGLDSVAATLGYMDPNKVSPDYPVLSAKQHITEQFHLTGDDRLIFVEQPTFHIDMSMTFVGAQEVVLNSTELREQYFSLDQPMTMEQQNTVKLENEVARALEEGGMTVIRKPWGGGEEQYNFFNGELVKSNDTVSGGPKKNFLTNGYFSSEESAQHRGRALQEDVVTFYQERDIEVLFTAPSTAQASLEDNGGIGYCTNAIFS